MVLKGKHCQTLLVVSTFTGLKMSWPFLTGKSIVLYIVEDGQNDSKNQSKTAGWLVLTTIALALKFS